MYKKLLKLFVLKNSYKFFIIFFCITLSLTGFLVSENLVNNIQTTIGNEAKPILGGDIKIETNKVLDENQLSYLEKLQNDNKIILSEKIQTYTTIQDKNDNPSLVSLIFVDDKFPLYGEFTTTEDNSNSGVYISQNVSDLFVINDKIEVYGQKYDIGGIITKFPESGFNLYDDGKKVVMDLSEFQKLDLQQLGAKISREYLIKVKNPADFESILKDLKDNKIFELLRIQDYKKGGDRFADTFSQLDKFIKYVLIISFILTILIIFLSVESFYIGNKKSFSILSILGLNNKYLLYFNILLFVFIFIICLLSSIFLSEFIFYFVRKFELTQGFYLDYITVIDTAILGIIILGVSITLPLIKFFSNNPLAGLKENFLQIYSKKEIIIETILVIIASIIIYNLIIGDFIGSIYFTIILFSAIFFVGYLLNFLLTFFYKKSYFVKNKNFSIYDSIRNTVKPGNLSILIIFGFIISFTSLFFISILSLNFLDKLNIDLKNENNIYIINLTDSDFEKIDEKYKKQAYSVILGRILTINGIDIKNHIGGEGEGMGARFTREFNITDNTLESVKILKGEKLKSKEVSVDNDFAKSLNVGIGDKIEFLIYGIKQTLLVSNIRESTSGSINPFFYFQVYPDDFKQYPKTYFLSTFIPLDSIKDFKNDFLAKTGNNISFIEVDQVVKEIKSITGKVFIIIQILFIYIFIFCTISLIISIVFLIPFKKKKSELYNIIGANTRFLKLNNLFEYIYLQSISFVLSIAIASGVSYYIINLSDFINYSISNYFLSFGLLLFIFILLLFIVKLLITSVTNKK